MSEKKYNDNSYIPSSSTMLRPKSCPNFASSNCFEHKIVDRKVKQPSDFTEPRKNETRSLLDNSTERDQVKLPQRDNNNIAPLNRAALCHQKRNVSPKFPTNVYAEGLVPLPLASPSNWSSALPSVSRMEVNPCLDSMQNNNIVMVEHSPSTNRSRKGHVENDELSIICPQVNYEWTHANHTRSYRDNESYDWTALHYPRLCSNVFPAHSNNPHQVRPNAKVGDEPIRLCVSNGLYPYGVHSMDGTKNNIYSGTFHDMNHFFFSMNGLLLRNDEFIDNAYQETNGVNCDDECCSYELHGQTDCDMLPRCNGELYDCSTDDEFTEFDVDGDENLFAVRPGNPVARVLESGDDDENLVPVYNEAQQNSSGPS